MCVCKIQWIDSRGIPTPDTNPAVGYAVVTFPDGSKGHPIPICAEHASRAHTMGNWRILPLPGTAEHLARVLLGPSIEAYNALRERLISALGYDSFRELQLEAFKHALGDK